MAMRANWVVGMKLIPYAQINIHKFTSLLLALGKTIKVRSRVMRATILIVGDYPALAMTRAELLREWQIVTTGTKGASDIIRACPYDMLLFCQTVSESIAEELAAQATELNPGTKVLAISNVGQVRQLGSSTFVAELHDPSRLRTVVAALLQSNY